jgi:transglutaminase-like putative cysteine protease
MDLNQAFRKLVFAQIMLSIFAFTLATGSPVLLIVCGLLAALAWYIVEGPRGKPLSQWVVMPVAMFCFVWLMNELFWRRGDMVHSMGRFTLWLQIVVLFGPKRNREYVLLLVLSLMLIIAASVLSESMLFGVLLVLYCVAAMCSVLLFQLKVTGDQVAHACASGAPPEAKSAAQPLIVGRGHRWHFRMIAVLVGMLCLTSAAVVFVAMPRTDLGGMRSPLSRMRFGRQVGFSDTVSLTGAPLGRGSDEIVLTMTVMEDGRRIGGEGRTWLVRGAALDTYNATAQSWTRGQLIEQLDATVPLPPEGEVLAPLEPDELFYDVQINQRLTSTPYLFTLHPVAYIASPNLSSVRFNPADQQLTASMRTGGVVIYVFKTPRHPTEAFFERYEDQFVNGWTGLGPHSNSISRVGPKFEQIGALARTVLRDSGIDPDEPGNDLERARALADFLRTRYAYELTNDNFIGGHDPTSEFLLHTKAGHCEMFASSLAAMARSQHIPARVVTGFLANEFNNIGGYYTVRQSDAHAWTEVYCRELGWVTLDATPPADVQNEHAVPRRWYTPLTEMYEHIEFAWVRSVVSFDHERRDRIIRAAGEWINGAWSGIKRWFTSDDSLGGRLIAWLNLFRKEFGLGWTPYVIIIIVIANVALLAVLGLRKINRRLGLFDRLAAFFHRRDRKASMQQRVRFYHVMTDLLARQGHQRREYQSPRRFAEQVARADPMRYASVGPLTDLFYEIRFGHRDLDTDRRHRIDELLSQLRQSIARATQ